MIVNTSEVKLEDNNNVNNSFRKLSLRTLFIKFHDSQYLLTKPIIKDTYFGNS